MAKALPTRSKAPIAVVAHVYVRQQNWLLSLRTVLQLHWTRVAPTLNLRGILQLINGQIMTCNAPHNLSVLSALYVQTGTPCAVSDQASPELWIWFLAALGST